MNTTLDKLIKGVIALVRDVEGEDPTSMRLMEIGFIAGQSVARTGQAPAGDPIEYSVGGSRVGLRKSEAARIIVQVPAI
jgi:Fe2+ transport system protein FeoA